MDWLRGLVYAFYAYVLIGWVLGGFLAFRGVNRLDPSAQSGTWGFRLLIWPACAALWPLLMLRYVRGHQQPPIECTAHRQAAGREV
ncbi:MAG: hypothetical protein H6510_12450 [Acidobacteria bacterium]|nr:hypothetical protein [Acidobacteriota bacterium]MCB9398616.1 hypothetical protein [Acidobacteriota bacterium]